MATFGPAYLTIGTEVSAKYRGAFCEAKVKKAIKLVKLRITLSGKDSQTSVWITDDQIVAGTMKVGSVVVFKHSDTGQVTEGVVNKVNDNSTYTVVFDDGDERTLRRNQLCLKGDKHFDVSETLDNLPLSHPEHFGTPVLKSKKAARTRTGDSESEKDDSSSEDDSPKRACYKNRHQELVGKVMLAEVADKRKGGTPTPALVVLPDAHPVELKNRDHLLVRSFRDTKFMAVNRKDLKEFSREAAIKNEDKALKAAFEKALLYFDNCELPSNWNREELLGPDDGEGDDADESSDDEEQCEERDRFVAQLYKFMDDRGTPINKGPCVGNKDLNLYRLFRVVQNIGGYNKATNQMKWRLVYSKMGLPPSNTAAHQIKNAYKKYLHAFEDFYRKLGSIMGTISRPGRQSRQTPSRGILPFRGREKDCSPRSPRTDKAAAKEEKNKEQQNKEEEKAKAKPEESSAVEATEEAREPTPPEEADDTVRRSTPRREKAQNQKEESKSDKKEDPKVRKEEEKKEETPSKEEKKKEEKREERKSLRQSQKDKEEEKKEAVKTKEEDKKEVKKEEGRTDRVLRKDLNDKEEEEKKEPEDSKEAQKKRVSRRKLARVEEEKKEGDDKEEDEEKADEKKEKKKPPPSAKKEKAAPKKKAEEEESEPKDKVSDNESEEDSPSGASQDQEVLSVGTRLRVRYGRGRNHKIYEAKVIEYKNSDPHKKYRVHYAGWNTRYDEWVERERIVKVIYRPELTKLKKKPLTAKSLKAPPAQTAGKAEIPFIKKRGRQPSTQQVPSPGGSSTKSSPVSSANEAKTPKSKASPAPVSAVSKTRSMRSNSTEIKPDTITPCTPKQRITRRSSGINESTDEPVTGDPEDEHESDAELEPAPPAVPGEADIMAEPPKEEETKEPVQDSRTEEKEEVPPPVESAVEFKPVVPKEEDSTVVKMEDSKSKRPDAENESLPPVTSVTETSPTKEIEPLLPPPPAQPPSTPDEKVVCQKDTSEAVPVTPTKQQPEIEEPVPTAVIKEVKEEQKTEETAPQLMSAQEEAAAKEDTKADEEKETQPSHVETPAVNRQEAEKAAPLHDPMIPQLKKIELDLPPVDDKKESKEKERLKPGKKLGRDFKKSRQNDMRTSFSEIPTLEPMTTPGEGKPAPVDAKPSPYDFNDTEADSPSSWQPEITKKWEPSNRPLPFFRDVKMELKKSLETEKKKVKKKNKKTVDEQSGESESSSPTKPSEKKTKDPSAVKKSRRKRTADGELKVDTSSYEETVNSVVESCKNDDFICLPVPPVLESKEEKPTKKRKKILQHNAAPEPEAGQEGDKEPAKQAKALKGKVGRKKKEAKAPETVTDQNANSSPLSVPCPDVHIPSSSSHPEKQAPAEPSESVTTKPPCSEAVLPPASLPASCGQGLAAVPVAGMGPSGLQILSMASIRPVPSTSGAAGAGPSDRFAPLMEGMHRELGKQVGVEPPPPPRVDCAGDMPKAACSVGNTVLDNTPPTTPENDLDEANSASSSSEGHDNLKEDLDSLDSVERTCKGGSESPPGCDFSLSSTSSENLPSSSSGAQSNGQPSQSSEAVSSKRKKKEDTTAAPMKKKRCLVSRSTRERNKKSPKYGDDDSQSRSPLHINSDSGLVSATNSDAIKTRVRRQPKFHFADDLGEYLEGEQRIQFLLDKMKEIRRIYQVTKSRMAAIDRKRKRARRMEKEREHSQASTGDKEAS